MHTLKDTEITSIIDGKAILLDVRTPDEFEKGHAAYSINIPLDEIENFKADESKKIFVYCRSGNRSQMAEIILSRMGYEAANIGGLYEAIDAMGEA